MDHFPDVNGPFSGKCGPFFRRNNGPFSGGIMDHFSAQGSLGMRSDGGNDDWMESDLGDATWIGSADEH